MKIYLMTGNLLPVQEVESALLLEADFALIERSGPMTIAYAISEIARQAMVNLKIKKIDSQVYESTWVIIFKREVAIEFLKEKLGNIDMVTIETPQ